MSILPARLIERLRPLRFGHLAITYTVTLVASAWTATSWSAPSAVRSVLDSFEYVSPVPGSQYVSPRNNIVLRRATPFEPATVDASRLSVVGSLSGRHSGTLAVSDDSRTLVFVPSVPFSTGEHVTVSLERLAVEPGAGAISGSFEFSVSPADPAGATLREPEAWLEDEPAPAPSGSERPAPATTADIYPAGYSHMSVLFSNNPEPGLLFLTPGVSTSSNLLIADNTGHPLFDRRLPSNSADLKTPVRPAPHVFQLRAQRVPDARRELCGDRHLRDRKWLHHGSP
jgi:hypothetical protein